MRPRQRPSRRRPSYVVECTPFDIVGPEPGTTTEEMRGLRLPCPLELLKAHGQPVAIRIVGTTSNQLAGDSLQPELEERAVVQFESISETWIR
jgi:hypothetical protein